MERVIRKGCVSSLAFRSCCFIMMTYKCMERKKSEREEEIERHEGKKSVEKKGKGKAKVNQAFQWLPTTTSQTSSSIVSCRKSFNNTYTKELVRRSYEATTLHYLLSGDFHHTRYYTFPSQSYIATLTACIKLCVYRCISGKNTSK